MTPPGPTANSRISAYFKPKPIEEIRKIAVKDILKSKNVSTSKGGNPFSLSKKTDNLTSKLSHFRLQSKEINDEVSDRQLRERKPMNLGVVIELEDDESSSGDTTSEDDEEEVVLTTRKRSKKRTISMLNDSDDDEDYVDENEQKDKFLNDQVDTDRVERLSRLYPNSTREEITEALEKSHGKIIEASLFLMETDTRKGTKRLKRRADYDEDDSYSLQKARARDAVEREIEGDEVLRFFNTATSQDIQDVTGCKPTAADKLVNELRPFRSMHDLEERLRTEKGVSNNFITAYKSLQQGYSATDKMIAKIELIGSDLAKILNVWKGEAESAASSRQGSPDMDEVEDEKAGTHIARLFNHDNSMHVDPDVYQDAMDGYLTKQPRLVNPEMKLKDYQILGVNWMLLLYRKNISGILADEMGLGKTAQVISFLARLYEMGDEGPHLVIVPSSTIENWVREFKRFAPKLQVRTYHGSQAERSELRVELEEDYDDYQVVVTTYNVATSNADDRYFLKRLNARTMILDEGHMVKNCFSSRYINLKKLNAPFRLLLTGTPLQNNLQELISLLAFIMPSTFEQFSDALKHVFNVKATISNDASGKRDSTASQMLSRNRIQRAKQLMTPFVLRRRKMDVLKDLPQKIHVREYCRMTKVQQGVYHDIVRESKKSFGQKPDAQYSNMVIHLRKAADHPMLFRNLYTDEKIKVMAKEIMKDVKYWDSEEQYIYEDMSVMSDFELNRLCEDHKVIKHHALKKTAFMDSGKIEKLRELLKKYKDNKILIFSQFTKMLDILEVVMKEFKIDYLRLDGETKVMERQSIIDQFNDDKDIPVFLLSTKAGGFGINLTSANIVILYDMDFNPQNDKQAEDRAHRVGQTQDVTIIRLITQNSIEEYILKLADIKLRLDKHISAGDDDEQDMENTETEKQNLRQMLQKEFENVD